MNKELEALNYVWYNYYTEELSQDEVEQIEKHLNIVQDGLKRLEAIDNANPSEALECLEYIENKLGGLRVECERIKNHRCDDLFIQEHIFTTIKQALIKAEQLDKIFLTPSDNSTFHFDYKDRKMVCMKENHYHEILRQEVFVKSKKELAWNIAIKKNVSLYWLRQSKNAKEYNIYIERFRDTLSITEEEFELLKEVLEND